MSCSFKCSLGYSYMKSIASSFFFASSFSCTGYSALWSISSSFVSLSGSLLSSAAFTSSSELFCLFTESILDAVSELLFFCTSTFPERVLLSALTAASVSGTKSCMPPATNIVMTIAAQMTIAPIFMRLSLCLARFMPPCLLSVFLCVFPIVFLLLLQLINFIHPDTSARIRRHP